ncbi:type II toxin-antitoxin system VapC family toxin [Streptomyces sp. LHD-70]|uniref:type II toxin-antitoxin system VapC family toxin n=1 Tax=Streptomyces sp. LHD-70 TaxID=3072140 RepID=UPI00280E2F94|nr:type II toxin-antitoxin system VapC family toxin [Streptomyces sp. LHD-70]MDQ8704553.1 type II toxin-antitoxin system VapC family toxin [Streptomyces sp. LHD-70]
MIVVDCSALVPALTSGSADAHLLRLRIAEAGTLFAPTLLDYEIQSALLGLERGGKLNHSQVTKAVGDYRQIPLTRHETLPFFDRIRTLRQNLSVYDAQYVALAEVLTAPLITCDARIARSGAAKCPVEVFGA